MVLLEDYILHLFVKKSLALDENTREYITDRVKFDEKLQRRIEEIEDFYKIYDDSSEMIDAGKIFAGNIIPLYPINTADKVNTTKLAASTDTAHATEFRHIKSFASAEHLIIAKIFYNSLTQRYSIYLIAENASDISNAIIKINGYGYFAADKNGFVNINGFKLSEDVNLTIFRPIINYPILKPDNQVTPKNNSDTDIIKGNGSVELKVKKYIDKFSVKLTTLIKSKGYKGIIIRAEDAVITGSFIFQQNRFLDFEFPDTDSKLIIIEAE